MAYGRRLKVGVLALLCGMGAAAQAGAADILNATASSGGLVPSSGQYAGIHIMSPNAEEANSDMDGLNMTAGQKVTLNIGSAADGLVEANSKHNVRGIFVYDTFDKSSVLVVNGPLQVSLNGTGEYSIVKGIESSTFRNQVGEGDQPQPDYTGGYIQLNGDTKVKVTSGGNGYGLIAGGDFYNNVNPNGSIFLRGNSDISVTTTMVGKGDRAQTMGVLAFAKGSINFGGQESTIHKINVSGANNGETNREIAGIYVSHGGQVNSNNNSTLDISVTGKKIYGINVGFYDQVLLDGDRKPVDYRGDSKVNLNGNTIISLNNKRMGLATGVESSMKSNAKLNSADIRFMNPDAANSNWLFGLHTEEEGKIDVGSLYIGTNGSTVTDPTKITAILTEGKADLYKRPYANSGTINVNTDDKGTVQVNGQVKSLDDGTINLHLTNANSYLYGNARVVYGMSEGTINLKLDNGAKWTNVRGDYDLDSEVTNLTLNNGALIDMTDTTYVNEAKHGKYQSIYVDQDMIGTGGTIHRDCQVFCVNFLGLETHYSL